MLVAALAICSLSTAVTCTIPALPADRALREISRLTGVRHTAIQEAQAEVLTIDVEDMPLAELRERIARVSACEWRQTPAGDWLLQRSQKLARDQERSETATRVGLIHRTIEERSAGLEKLSEVAISSTIAQGATIPQEIMSPNPEIQQRANLRFHELKRETPGGRALRRLMHSLPISEIAKVRSGQRVVYSTSPNPMQVRLPREAQGILRTFNEENRSWMRKVAADRSGLASQQYYDLRYGTRQFRPAEKLVLSIRISTGTFSAVLSAIDADGWVIAQGSDYYPFHSLSDPPPAGIREKTLSLSREALEASAAVISRYGGWRKFGGEDVQELWARWTPRLYAPESSEPLSWWAGPWASDLARSQGKQLVAALPDQALDVMSTLTIREATSSQALAKLLQRVWRLNFAVSEDCIEITPLLAAQNRAERLDRALMGIFGRDTLRQGASLENVAAYVVAQPSPNALLYVDRLYTYTEDAIQGSTSPTEQFNFFNIPMLKLYGTLSPQQRQGLWAGRSVPSRELSAPAKAALQRLVYGWNYRMPSLLEVELPPQPEPDVVLTHAWQEPTEVLPNGVPATATLQGAPSLDRLLVGSWSNGGETMRTVMGAEDYGGFFNQTQAGKEAAAFESYEFAESKQLKMTVQLSHIAKLPWVFGEVRVLPGSRVSGFDELPVKLREEIARAAAMERTKAAAVKKAPPPP